MFCRVILPMKPVTDSTAACQRPGTSWRLVPPHMNSRIAASTASIHSAELVNWNGLAVSSPPPNGAITNWCMGSILAAAATGFSGPWSGASVRAVLDEAHGVEAPAREGEEHQHDHDPRLRVEQFVEREADHDPAERVADHGRDDLRRARPGTRRRRVFLGQPFLLGGAHRSDP